MGAPDELRRDHPNIPQRFLADRQIAIEHQAAGQHQWQRRERAHQRQARAIDQPSAASPWKTWRIPDGLTSPPFGSKSCQPL